MDLKTFREYTSRMPGETIIASVGPNPEGQVEHGTNVHIKAHDQKIWIWHQNEFLSIPPFNMENVLVEKTPPTSDLSSLTLGERVVRYCDEAQLLTIFEKLVELPHHGDVASVLDAINEDPRAKAIARNVDGERDKTLDRMKSREVLKWVRARFGE